MKLSEGTPLLPYHISQPNQSMLLFLPLEWVLNLAPATAINLTLFLVYGHSLLVIGLSPSGLMSVQSFSHTAANIFVK